jgi:hypothetical protein
MTAQVAKTTSTDVTAKVVVVIMDGLEKCIVTLPDALPEAEDVEFWEEDVEDEEGMVLFSKSEIYCITEKNIQGKKTSNQSVQT